MFAFLEGKFKTFHFLNSEAPNNDEARVFELSWLIHCLRMLYAQLIDLSAPER